MTSRNHVLSSNYVLLQALRAQGAMSPLIMIQAILTMYRVPLVSGERDRKPRAPTRVCVLYPVHVTRVVTVSVASVTVSPVALVTNVISVLMVGWSEPMETAPLSPLQLTRRCRTPVAEQCVMVTMTAPVWAPTVSPVSVAAPPDTWSAAAMCARWLPGPVTSLLAKEAAPARSMTAPSPVTVATAGRGSIASTAS